jgi:hypothetical protein
MPNNAKKLYDDTLKAIDKGIDELDKKVKAMSPNSTAITKATYATSAGKHLSAANRLVAMDPILTFNLLISMADASHTDPDATPKMYGKIGDGSTPTFKLDAALLPLIEARAAPIARAKELTEVPHRWTREDANVGPFKTGWPNAQQRNQMYRRKLAWEKDRRAKLRERREKTEDWVAVALADLKEGRDYLDQYGVEEYLPLSIQRLENYSW